MTGQHAYQLIFEWLFKKYKTCQLFGSYKPDESRQVVRILFPKGFNKGKKIIVTFIGDVRGVESVIMDDRYEVTLKDYNLKSDTQNKLNKIWRMNNE